MEKINKIVLAYSGGLDTAVAIAWLKERYECDIIAYCADVGQGVADLEQVRSRAIETGASDVIIEDLKEEFVTNYVFPMLRANALYEGKYMLGTSIARPLIAKRQIEVAKSFGADAVAHGATGKGNDQVRFEFTYMSMMPSIKIIAPWRIWSFKSRENLIDYAQMKKIPITASKEKPYSIDRNLLHVSFEGGILEDTWNEPPSFLREYSVAPEDSPDRAEYLELGFEKGNPVSIDGVKMSGAELLNQLNVRAGANGIGRICMVENRYVGMKSRGVYETPGGTLILTARKELESIVLDREVMHIREEIAPRYASLVYNGYWFSPERAMIQAMTDSTQDRVTGTVNIKMYKGNCQAVGSKSDFSLFDKKLATFGEDDVYNQSLAEGFIRLNALRLGLGRG